MDVSIAVIGHGHRRYLQRLFSSIFNREIRRSFEVVFIDNDSSDGSAELVEEGYPEVRIVRNLRPRGFAANNNMAFTSTSGHYFMMLNPDTELERGALDELADVLDTSGEAGACGPGLVFPDGRLQLSCRRFPTVRSFLMRRTPLRLLWPRGARDRMHLMQDFDHERICSVDWLLGACVLVRREAYEMVRGMDERLRMYCEDIDLCYRLHRAGWEVVYVPRATVIHHHLAATDHTFFTRGTLSHYRSMFRYVRKHGIRLR